jgi:hypothetical protein
MMGIQFLLFVVAYGDQLDLWFPSIFLDINASKGALERGGAAATWSMELWVNRFGLVTW